MRLRISLIVLLGLSWPAWAQMTADEVQICVNQCNSNHDTEVGYFSCVEERCNDGGGESEQQAGFGLWHVGSGEYGRYAGVLLEGFEGETGGILYFCSRGMGRLLVFGLDGGGDSMLQFTIGSATYEVPLTWVNESWWEVMVAPGSPLVDSLMTGTRLSVSNPGIVPFWEVSLSGSAPTISLIQAEC